MTLALTPKKPGQWAANLINDLRSCHEKPAKQKSHKTHLWMMENIHERLSIEG